MYMGFQFKEEVNVFIWTLLLPFDASMIFIKEGIMMLLRISMLLNHIEKCQWVSKTKQSFYSVRNPSSPSTSCLTKRLDLPQEPFRASAPKDVGLLIFPSLVLFCWAWITDDHSFPAISCPLVSSTLSHPEPLVGREMHSIRRGGAKGHRVQFPPLPSSHCQSIAAMKGWAKREQRRNGASLCWARPMWVPHTVCHLAGHKTSITESAPSNWIFFGSASIRNHYIMLLLRFSHYFCANSQKGNANRVLLR